MCVLGVNVFMWGRCEKKKRQKGRSIKNYMGERERERKESTRLGGMMVVVVGVCHIFSFTRRIMMARGVNEREKG